MPPSDWDRIQEIYYAALPVFPADRPEFVARACNFDPLLTREVTSLLEADEAAEQFLEPPVFGLGLKIISDGQLDQVRASPTDFIGSTIDRRYLIEKELGHGGIGAVYLARDLTLHHKPVVVKVLLQAAQQDPYVLKKFRQEVEALARIDHPAVVSVLGAGELADRKPYILMQFVDGVTLRSQIPAEGINLERAASIVRQVGDALDTVHEKGILHRDLKPENIMLQAFKRGHERVRIVDFGIAKVKNSVIAPSTINQAPVGTLLYMSPEQLRGEKLGPASDVYSLGVIAYEMVTGRRPFIPVSGSQLVELHRGGVRLRPCKLRPDLSTEAQSIILRALSFAAEDRYQSASEFGDSLARALTYDESAMPAVPLADLQVLAQPETIEGRREGISADASTVQDSDLRASQPHPSIPVTRVGLSRRSSLIVTAVLALIFTTSVAAIYVFRKTRSNANTAVAAGQRSFSYWLTVQKMRDGRKYQGTFQSSGQEVFENGYKFRLNFASADPGYLYVFNVGPPDADNTTLTMVYPTPSRSNTLVSGQPVQTNWNTFGGRTGTENFWIIWSTSPVDEFESMKAAVFDNEKGAVTDENSSRLIHDFIDRHSDNKLETSKDAVAQQTHVSGTGAVLVKLAQLEHR
jgi:serine/threonine protein kinase